MLTNNKSKIYTDYPHVHHDHIVHAQYQHLEKDPRNFTIKTLRLRQDGRRFPDDTFERIFLKENVVILIKISL